MFNFKTNNTVLFKLVFYVNVIYLLVLISLTFHQIYSKNFKKFSRMTLSFLSKCLFLKFCIFSKKIVHFKIVTLKINSRKSFLVQRYRVELTKSFLKLNINILYVNKFISRQKSEHMEYEISA